MIGFAMLEEPDQEADAERDANQDEDSLKKVSRQRIRETENNLLSFTATAMPRPVAKNGCVKSMIRCRAPP